MGGRTGARRRADDRWQDGRSGSRVGSAAAARRAAWPRLAAVGARMNEIIPHKHFAVDKVLREPLVELLPAFRIAQELSTNSYHTVQTWNAGLRDYEHMRDVQSTLHRVLWPYRDGSWNTPDA